MGDCKCRAIESPFCDAGGVASSRSFWGWLQGLPGNASAAAVCHWCSQNSKPRLTILLRLCCFSSDPPPPTVSHMIWGMGIATIILCLLERRIPTLGLFRPAGSALGVSHVSLGRFAVVYLSLCGCCSQDLDIKRAWPGCVIAEPYVFVRSLPYTKGQVRTRW